MLSFLSGDSEMARRIAVHDWTATALGDPAHWPQSLKTLVGVMLEANQPMFIVWGPSRTLLYNDRYIAVLQGHHPDALGSDFLEVWSEIVDDLRPLVEAAYDGRSSHMDDIMLMMERNGYPEETHFAYSYTPIRREGGGVDGFFCPCIETTEQVMSARVVLESEVRNRQIFDSAIDYAIVATDLEGRVASWNEGARRVLGWTEEEMLGEPLDRFFTPEDRAAARPQAEMRAALETGRGADERWHLRKDGERFWGSGEMTPLRDAADRPIGFVKVLRDRTRERRADEALWEMNATLEQQVAQRTADRNRLWQLSADIMLVAGFDGCIEAVNPAWTRILGWGEGELVGQPLFDFVHPDDLEETIGAAAAIGRGQSFARFENRYRCRDGSFRDISWSAGPGDGKIIAVGRDVTDDKTRIAALTAAEEQLRQAQKVEAIGQLTGGVAHDFNNLLTVIRGSIDLLRRPDVAEERRRRYIDAIADTTERATKLTSQLLAFARRQSLKPETFDAGASVRAAQELLRTLLGSRIRIVVDVDGACPINADRSQFDAAIVNVAVNARDAMGGEGTLSIAVGRVEGVPAIRSHPFIPGEHVAVILHDTGSGIPADSIDRIFEPFFTTKGVGEGTGLGLSQVFGFAKQSGGQVIVESRPGEGATFTLYLPLAPDVHDAIEQATDPECHTIGEGACILVVEDNAEVGRFATQALAELGYDTVLATDAATALGELATSGDRFDVVFTDVVMPGMSGIELGQEIRKHHPTLPVILTSGYSNVLAQDGTHGFELLRKPYSIDELARVLRKTTAWRGASDLLAACLDSNAIT